MLNHSVLCYSNRSTITDRDKTVGFSLLYKCNNKFNKSDMPNKMKLLSKM